MEVIRGIGDIGLADDIPEAIPPGVVIVDVALALLNAMPLA